MFESGDSQGFSGDALQDVSRGVAWDTDACAAGMLGVLSRDVRDENVRRARMVEAVCEIAELRMAEAEERYRDPADAYREVQCEIAATLDVSLDVARTFVSTAERLHAMPLTAIRFVCGALDWRRVVVLTSMLSKASDRTIRAIEYQAVAAAERFNPRSLRKRLWHLWMLFDKDEATAAQKESATLETRVRIDPRDNGMSTLIAHMTDLQGAEAEQLISGIVSTVCKNDPRSMQQLRVDGLIALLHGEHALECACDTGDECPVAGIADAPAPRRGHLLQIMVDVETLLGLASNPATLPDGTALDPDVVRLLAEDAQWQAILTELVTVLETAKDAPAPPVTEPNAAASAGPTENTTDAPPALRRVLGRGRVGPPAALPEGATYFARSAGSLDTWDDAAVSVFVAQLLATVQHNPSHPGAFPDGHGGIVEPPATALVYRPSAETADLVRTAYRCCAFPGCEALSAACELDHIVPFDHTDPAKGGWTIASNLQPLCKAHHQAKTAKMWRAVAHAHGAIVWTSRSGIVRVTLPDFALPTKRSARRRKRKTKPIDPERRTWWERNMPDGAVPPTADDQRRAESDAARRRIRRIRRRFREHRAILRLREHERPAPF